MHHRIIIQSIVGLNYKIYTFNFFNAIATRPIAQHIKNKIVLMQNVYFDK